MGHGEFYFLKETKEMRSFLAIAALFAAVNADGHDKEDWNMNDWNKDMDHSGMDHGMDWDKHHDDMMDMDCMMTGWGCDSAISLGASAAAIVATLAIAI